MTTLTISYGTKNSYGVVSSLSAGAYDTTFTAYNAQINGAADTLFEYGAAVAANPTGNKQIILFIQGAFDNLSWPAYPTSSTDTTHDTSMRVLGVISCNGGAGSEFERGVFSVAAAFGGTIPPFWRVIPKNDCGVAMSTCAARTQDVTLTAA
jgi:hypothetical protein